MRHRHLVLVLLTAFIAELGGFSVSHPRIAEASIVDATAQDRSAPLVVPSVPEPSLEQVPTSDSRPMLGGVPAPQLPGRLVMQTYSLDFYRLPGGMRAATIQAFAMSVE